MIGPKISMSCESCEVCTSEKFQVQGDNGYDVYCEHSSLEARKHISAYTWTTPTWCPALPTIQIKEQDNEYHIKNKSRSNCSTQGS